MKFLNKISPLNIVQVRSKDYKKSEPNVHIPGHLL